MCFRHVLASLHFNENVKREVQTDKDGNPYFKVSYPKFKQGEEGDNCNGEGNNCKEEGDTCKEEGNNCKKEGDNCNWCYRVDLQCVAIFTTTACICKEHFNAKWV